MGSAGVNRGFIASYYSTTFIRLLIMAFLWFSRGGEGMRILIPDLFGVWVGLIAIVASVYCRGSLLQGFHRGRLLCVRFELTS